MAGSLGSLVVSLGLNAVEFTPGLTKSEYEAKKFAQRMDRAIATGAKAAGAAILGLGAAAATAFGVISKLASDAGNFKDLEEQTGASAEAIAAFAVAAGTAGVEISTIAAAMNKLSKSLVGVDDESKDAGAALAALGLPIKDFKALDPASQLEAVAKALAGFEDGAAKTAVAMALFGKSGAALLPVMKELAAEGGRQVILTQQQIERADAFADAQARVRTQVQLYLQALATEALPTITSITKATKEFVASLLGVSTEARKLDGEVIRQFAEKGALALAFLVDAADGVSRTFQAVGLSIAAGLAARNEALKGNLEGAREIISSFQKDIRDLFDRPLYSNTLKKELLDAAALRRLAGQEDRGFKPPGRQLVFEGKVGGAGSKNKEQVTEAQKYLDSLDKQLERTRELTFEEQARLDIAKGIKGITADLEQQIIAKAQLLDFEKALKAFEDDRRRTEEEASRIREQNSKALTQQIDNERKEAQAIRDGNTALEEQIVFIKGGQDAIDAYNIAKVEKIINEKKDRVAMLENVAGNEELVAAIKEQISALEKRNQLTGDIKLAEQMKIEADKLQDLKNTFSDALVTPLMDFINQTKSAKDAFKSFINNIQQILQEKAARGLADYIFGGKTGGGFDFSTILKLLSGFGGFGGGGTGFLPPGAAGTPMFANGTSFAPGGRAWVGENGPELAPLPRGARVMPSAQSMRMAGNQMVFNVNVMPGADTRSARQAGGLLRDVVVRAIKDR